jgi:inositol 2-dehydrogenase
MGAHVNVGISGLGRIGRFHAINLAQHIPLAKLMRIVDANEDLARTVSEQLGGIPWSTDYRDLLHDPAIEAVVIATPTPLHVEMIEAAAAAGKHIFCEKPISLDLESTYRAIDAVSKANVSLQVGFHRRFDPDYRNARERIVSDEIGQIYLFRTSVRDMRAPSFDFIKGSGGLFIDFTLHDFDATRWLIGEIEEITAVGAVLSDPDFERGGHIDNAIITLRFVGGALGVIDNSLVAGYGYECSSEIMGSKATLHIGNHRRTSVEVLTAGGIYHDQVSDFVERFGTAYRAEMESFVYAVYSKKRPDVGGADAAAAFVLARAAQRSHHEKKSVKLSHIIQNGEILYQEIH